MNTLIRDQWVKALRSGKYVQHRGELCGGTNCYCPLAVLGITQGFTILSDDNTFEEDLKTEGRVALYPSLTKFNITSEEMSEIVLMNDNKDYSFEEIADYIEKNL